MCGYHKQGSYALAFGLGLTFSCFFPIHFVITAGAIIIVILAVSLLKC